LIPSLRHALLPLLPISWELAVKESYVACRTIKKGVVVVTGESGRRRLMFLGGLIFLVAVALLSLNLPQLFFEPLPSFYRMVDQALLVAGLLGSLLTSKPLRIAGWTGICLYILYVVFGSVPSLDHPAFDSSGEQRPELWMPKLALWLALSVSLVVCFRKLAAKSQ
jgi:hypothetical protein